MRILNNSRCMKALWRGMPLLALCVAIGCTPAARRTATGEPVPTDLYLRSGFFAQPELHRWRIGTLRLERRPNQFDHKLRRRQLGVPIKWLEVERFAGARNFVFVPPHAIEVRAVPGLEIDRDRMWLRQSKNSEQTDYAVAYQDLPGPQRGDFPDPRGQQLGLLTMPTGLDRPDLGFPGAWLTIGDQQLHLLQLPVPEAKGQHFAVRVDDIRAAVATIRAKGVEIGEPRPLADVCLQAFFNDPAGNSVELNQPL